MPIYRQTISGSNWPSYASMDIINLSVSMWFIICYRLCTTEICTYGVVPLSVYFLVYKCDSSFYMYFTTVLAPWLQHVTCRWRVYMCTCTCTHVHVHIDMYMYMYMYMYMSVHFCTCLHVHVHVHAHCAILYMYMYFLVCMHMYIYLHAHVHVHIQYCTCTCKIELNTLAAGSGTSLHVFQCSDKGTSAVPLEWWLDEDDHVTIQVRDDQTVNGFLITPNLFTKSWTEVRDWNTCVFYLHVER